MDVAGGTDAMSRMPCTCSVTNHHCPGCRDYEQRQHKPGMRQHAATAQDVHLPRRLSPVQVQERARASRNPGPFHGNRLVDMTGKEVKGIRVLRREGRDVINTCATWRCVCAHGKELIARGTSLRRGMVRCHCEGTEGE